MLERLRQWLTPSATGPRHPAFDAVLDLDGGSLPAGLDPAAAIEAVRTRLSQEPGMRRLSVRVRAAPVPIVLRVFAPGTVLERQGPAWSTRREYLLAAARSALGPARHPSAEPPLQSFAETVVPSHGPGFAETIAPSHAVGLEALAALASAVRSIPAAAPPVPPSPAPKLALDRPRSAEPPPATVAPDPADVERLVRLLQYVLPDDDQATARRALSRFGSYPAVLAAPASELLAVRGLGPHSVAAIRLVHEAAIRFGRAAVASQPVLDNSARLIGYLTAVLAREPIEQFRVLFLDEAGMLLADEVQARGTVNQTPVYPREVVRRALELRASALVLVHNHPSGDPTPSRDDIVMTRQVRLAASALDIALRDHVIVGNGCTTSFREAGLLS